MLLDDTTTMRDSSRIHVEERGDEQRHDLPPSQKVFYQGQIDFEYY